MTRSTVSTPKTKPRAKRTNGKRMTVTNQMLANFAREIAVRSSVAARLGMSYSDNRDIYTALGYTKTPLFADYQARYQRDPIARAVIDRPVKACWRKPPVLTESDEAETTFEKEWVELVDRLKLWRYFQRLDRMAGIGTYSVLLLGFDDGFDLDQPVQRAGNLLYVMPYDENNAKVQTYVMDTNNARYGLPLEYLVTLKKGSQQMPRKVHWSRVIHVAEDPLDNDVEGIPKLRPILNRLQDLGLVVGGSAEMFWRGAFPGLAAILREGYPLKSQSRNDVQDEMENYIHGFQRILRLSGVDIQQLAPQVADPSRHVSVILDCISAGVGMPKRILMGSERGELASSMDEENWITEIESRQGDHCEGVIIRPFIDRLTSVQVLSQPAEGYTLNWPDLRTKSDKQKAEVGETVARALKAYVEALGAEEILPRSMFLRKLGLTEDEIQQAEEIIGKMMDESAAEEEQHEGAEPIEEVA